MNAPRTMCGAVAAAAVAANVTVASAQWESGPALPAVAQPRLFAAGVNSGGTLLAIGGSPFTNPPSDDAAVHYLPAGAADWLAATSVEGPIVRQGAGIDDLGRIVVFGGVDGTDPEGDTGQVYVYDVIEGQYQGLADRTATAPADYFAWATDAQGRLYSIGGGPGDAASAGNENSAHVERYTGSMDAWEVIAPLPVAVGDATAAFDGNGRILVFGGIDATASARLSAVQSFDIAAGAWSIMDVPDLPTALSGARAVLGADERIYVMGGVSGPVGSGTLEDSVWVLHLPSNTWSAGPSMVNARSHFAAMLGSDDFLYAVGGHTNVDGGVERLYSPPCPSFAADPLSRESWIGGYVTLSATVEGGTPLSYQWQRNGEDLNDGPSALGDISGATTAMLVIANATEVASGEYALRAMNPCGETLSAAATLTMKPTTPVPATWEMTSLHPAWAINSSAQSVSATHEVGSGSVIDPTYGEMAHPTRWSGSAASVEDLLPAGSVGGSALATAGDVTVGWWWWPYACYVGGQWQTCYSRQAAMWEGSPITFINLQYSGWEYSTASDTDGTQIVGTITTDDASGNTYAHAVYKSSPSTFWQDLHPPDGVVSKSGATAVDAGRQYGWVHTPFPGPVQHAAMWSGSAATFVDLQPAGAVRSAISGAGDGQQVGSAEINGGNHPGLWTGSAASFVDLHPAGGGQSTVNDCAGGLQVGAVGGHAAIWSGSADSWYDLHAATLGSQYSGSSANGIHVDAQGNVRIVGSAYNPALMRTEAILWAAGGPVAGDLDANGVVDVFDLFILLNNWGTDGAGADLAAPNNVVDVFDLFVLLGNWG